MQRIGPDHIFHGFVQSSLTCEVNAELAEDAADRGLPVLVQYASDTDILLFIFFILLVAHSLRRGQKVNFQKQCSE